MLAPALNQVFNELRRIPRWRRFGACLRGIVWAYHATGFAVDEVDLEGWMQIEVELRRQLGNVVPGDIDVTKSLAEV